MKHIPNDSEDSDIPDLSALCFKLAPRFDLVTACKLFQHRIVVLCVVASYVPYLQVN